MREERTAESQETRTFEERVLAKFDLVDERLENVTIRLGKLEERQYDTKPIWERALAAIVEMNDRMNAGFNGIRAELKVMNLRMDAVDQRFNKQEMDSEHNFRKIKRRLDALNETLLEIRADQHYVDSRLAKIEEQVFPDDPF